jgi:hypothetical protein
MGKLLYADSGIEIEFDDRALAHIQIAIGTKLRRRESFMFSWKDDIAVGSGRSSIWMDATIPLYFKFYDAAVPTINRDWIDALVLSSNSSQGLVYSTEPGSETPPPRSYV